jgi:hypothetical protein
MWTRRDLGAAALGMGAAAALPGASALAAPGRRSAPGAAFGLAPRVGANWAKHQSQSAARLLQLPAGVRLQAGPMGAVDRNGIAIWSRASWTGDFRVSFRTTKLDANVGAGPETLFLLLYFGVQGDGTPGRPASLAAWPAATTPYTHAYADHIRGARVTFYLQPPGASGEVQPISAAYFKADGSRNAVAASVNEGFPGLRGVTYGWTVRRTGDTVTVTQTGGGGRTRVARFTHPGFGEFAGSGSFGLLASPGRVADVTSFAVSR